MSDEVPLATGDIERIQRLHEAGEHVRLTCPERSGACAYQFGPDRPDDYGLEVLLDYPFCVDCGCSLVLVSAGDYDGPPHEFRSMESSAAGGPVCL